ncbi:DUF3422 family protein [Neptunomonas sp.]|uniref:DUF3422 family protein n=1 Tax=Neptunomonas sp. TaxID=1971898 RepID=UPI003564C604
MYNYHKRQEILDEVHARPFQNLGSPLSLVHIAVLFDGMRGLDIERQVFELIRTMGFEFDIEHQGFLFCDQLPMAIRYEPHNEFYTLTIYQFDFLERISLPVSWLEHLPGALLAGVEILVRKKTGHLLFKGAGNGFRNWSENHFDNRQLTSSHVMNEAAVVATDFQVKTDSSFVQVLVEDTHLLPAQAGLLVQRVCEIETYRHMALISLPMARSLMPKLTVLDQKLAAVSQRTMDEDVADVLAQMMALAAEVEALSAGTANRFAASEAYFALVEKSIQELRESRVEGVQMVEEFMDRHLNPARRTCRSAAARIELLSKRIARATELIQSQVNLAIEKQNKELLEALNTRGQRKMKLQAKLESLSVVVVVYYMYDLVDTALKNLLHAGALLEQLLIVLTISLPLIIVLTYWMIRRLMKGLREE